MDVENVMANLDDGPDFKNKHRKRMSLVVSDAYQKVDYCGSAATASSRVANRASKRPKTPSVGTIANPSDFLAMLIETCPGD